MPLSIFILRTRFGYWIAMTAAGFSLLLNVTHGVGYAVKRVDSEHFGWLRSLMRAPSETVEVQWGTKPVESITVREPYTNREIYARVGETINKAGTLGLIGGFNAEGYLCFGTNLSNRVVVLKDCRSDVISSPPVDVNCVIVEGFNSRAIDPALLSEYRLIFRAFRNGVPIFACYEREARS